MIINDSREDIIKSKDNKIFKKINSLSSKKFRDKYGQYILEGDKLVKEAIARKVAKTVVVSKDSKLQIRDYGEAFVFMEGKLFQRLTLTENSQGVFAIVDKIEFSKEEFLKRTKGKNLIILDRIQDPGNLGTILRTALASGFGGAVLVKGCVDVYNPKVVRSAANVLLNLPILCLDNYDDVTEVGKAFNRSLIGTDFNGVDFMEAPILPDEAVSIIIGNEGQGVEPELLAKTNMNVKIPMSQDVESLNVAVAAGILMYRWKGI